MLQFVGVDGEGVTRADGSHDYVLLSVGDQSLHREGERLTYRDIFPFLYRQHQLNPNAAYVGFYLGYDFSQWLRDLPRDVAWMLLHPDGIALRGRRKSGPLHTPFPVRWDGWEFDLLDGKRFKLRPAVAGDEPWAQENVWSWLWICDAGSFWQSSFLTAINPKNWTTQAVCTPGEYETILAGKQARASATFEPSMITYNVTENRVLARAMAELDKGFRSHGWVLRRDQWFGPGQAVNKWLAKIKAPTRVQVETAVPAKALRAAQQAFYGGWFEITIHGHVGTLWEYDINSAYPDAIRQLPCILHGDWIPGDTGILTIARVRYEGSNPYLGGLPHRDKDGRISRPIAGSGWYWMHEIEAACKAGLIDSYTVTDVWTYRGCSCEPPLASIADLYEHRLTVGKNTAYGKADKLVINSAYGKTAQSVGTPTYANAVYAGLITAACRVKILDAIGTHPVGAEAVAMVATDGVYFTSEHPGLDVDGTRLGAWDVTRREGMCLFMPGVYWDDETRASLGTDKVKIKSRGVNPYDLAAHVRDLDRAFKRTWDGWPSFDLPVRFAVTSPREAVHRNDWTQCGRVMTDGVRHISSNPETKRAPHPYYDHGVLRTRPWEDLGESVPYSREFGHGGILGEHVLTEDGDVNGELVDYLYRGRS